MTKIEVLFVAAVALSTMWLAGCGQYKCSTTFGASTCTPGPPGISQGQTGGTSTNAAFVFVVNSSGGAASGTIDRYTLDTSSKTLSATANYTAPTIPVDTGAGMVIAQVKFLYAAFRTTGQIFGWTISSAGELTAVANSPYSPPFLASINPGAVGQQNMITNPLGTLLFLSDPAGARIFAYQIGTGGVLTEVPNSPFPVPFGPLNLATVGKGRYLYATNGFYGTHTGSEIAAYSISSSGSLSLIGTYPFSMWQVAGEPSGKYLIGTTGNGVPFSGVADKNLYIFSIDQAMGALTQAGKFSTQSSPFTIAVQPNASGNLVYSFGINDAGAGYSPVEGYQISSTGILSAVSGSPFGDITLGFWGQFDQSGAFLLDYSGSINAATSNVLTKLGVLNVASGGAITTPIAPATLATGGYWAVTDVP
jgi:6-phosphogluconolactonase (cycloisomerase 2 family)